MPVLSMFTPLGLLRLSSRASDAEAMYRAKIAGLGGQFGTDAIDPHVDATAYAEAIREAFLRERLQRAGGQALPSQLVEMLATREVEYGATPAPSDTLAARRGAVAALAKLPLGNSRNNVENALRDLLGADFVRYVTPDPTDPSESLDWPAALGNQPMNLQRPDVPLKLVTLDVPIATLGSFLTVPYTVVTPFVQPDPYVPHLVDGDVIVVSPGTLGNEERIIVGASTIVDATHGTFLAVFAKAHHTGSLATTQPWPEWLSTRRQAMVVLKDAAANDPVTRAKVDDLMARMMRDVTQWAVVAETIVDARSTFGPFLLDSSPLGATPFWSESPPFPVSAVVDFLDPITIRVMFSEAVTFVDQTDVTLNFSVGGPTTILGDPTGIGTAVLLYTLIDPLVYTDALSIVYGASNNYVDGHGRPLAAVSVPVQNNLRPDILSVANLYEYWDTTAGLSAVGGLLAGASVYQWTGQVAGLIFSNTGANQPTVDLNHFGDNATDISFVGTTPQILQLTNPPSPDFFNLALIPTVTAFALIRGSYGGAAGVIFEQGTNYAVATSTIELEDSGATGFVAHTKGNVGLDTWTSAGSLGGANRHLLEVDYDYTQPAFGEVVAYLDGSPSGSLVAANNSGNFNADVLNLGARAGLTLGGTFRIAALGFIKGIPSAADRTTISDYLRLRFPAMV